MPRSGLLLGRSPESDIILSDPAASQRHALLLGSAAGLQILPLGRNSTLHNGKPATPGALLAAGDTLEVPGGRFVVREGLGAPGELSTAWWLGFPGGERYGLPTP
ncbi:MAG: FHA domain-containing protein, partial [Deltaproteobacteria bacterium]|nr:FHA domain-containing protein [Deltaproteobacteria bacterium]